MTRTCGVCLMKPRTDRGASSAPPAVVASVLVEVGSLVLLRRSAAVTSDAGLWHCVTGYVEDGRDPCQQAIQEIAEETGLDQQQLSLRSRPHTVSIVGTSGIWLVYCAVYDVLDTTVTLNWENDAICKVSRLGEVPGPFVRWLPQVLDAVGWRGERPSQAVGHLESRRTSSICKRPVTSHIANGYSANSCAFGGTVTSHAL